MNGYQIDKIDSLIWVALLEMLWGPLMGPLRPLIELCLKENVSEIRFIYSSEIHPS